MSRAQSTDPLVGTWAGQMTVRIGAQKATIPVRIEFRNDRRCTLDADLAHRPKGLARWHRERGRIVIRQPAPMEPMAIVEIQQHADTLRGRVVRASKKGADSRWSAKLSLQRIVTRQ